MNRLKIFGICAVVLSVMLRLGVNCYAQVPVISQVEPNSGTALSTVSIAGRNFGTDLSDIQVLFGGVRANILSVTDGQVEVEVPPYARYENITVAISSLSRVAYAQSPFLLSFSGSSFDPALISAPQLIPEAAGFQDLCTCDFDGDGRSDVATTNDNSAQVNVYFDISPDFLTYNTTSINAGVSNALITCADINGDGRAEILVNEEGSNTTSVSILRNTSTPGTISFQSPLLISTSENAPKKIAVQDLNLDGRPDLVVPNASGSVIDIFLNNATVVGQISFQSPRTIDTESSFDNFDIEIGDLNNDQYPDLAVASNLDRDLFILQNNGAASNFGFDRKTAITLPSNSTNLSMADFDNDNKLDIVVNQLDGDGLILLRNTSPAGGDISMSGAAQVSVSSRPWDVAVGDLNGDGRVDIVSTSNASSNTISVLINDGSFSFTRHDIPAGERTLYVDLRDMSGDGKPDIVLSGISNNNVIFLKNTNCVEPGEIEVEPATSICSGQTATLRATKGLGISYSWTRDGTPLPDVTDFIETTVGGSFEVTLTSESGACVFTSDPVNISSFTDAVPSLPDILGGDDPVCPGEPLTLSTSSISGATYEWSGPNGFSSSEQNPIIADFGADNVGTYELQITTGNCSSEISTKLININDVSDLVIQASGPTEVCEGTTNVVLSTTAEYDSYQWRLDGVDITDAVNSNFTATGSGNYSVEIMSGTCSRVSETISVSIIPLPTAAFDVGDEICVDSPTGFNNTSEFTGAPLFEWSFGDGTFSNDVSPVHTYTLSGVYNVRLNVSFGGGCENEFSKTIEVKDDITAEIESSADSSLCEGESTTLTVLGDWQSYNWSPGNETSAQIEVGTTGTYSVELLNSSGCIGRGEIEIVVFPSPIIEVSTEAAFIEPGESVQLSVSGADSYLWSPAETLDDSVSANPVATPDTTTVYRVIGSNVNLCSTTAEILIEVDNTIRLVPSKFISPNGDSRNDVWQVQGIESYPECTVKIFTDTGGIIYESKPYLNDWAGTIDGDELPNGVYYFIITCEGVEGNVSAGSITLLK